MKTYIPIVAVVLLMAAGDVFARVKLVALPDRARVVVSMSNPDVALVEEERVLTLQKGLNDVDFSWQGVNIDSSSIQIRVLDAPDKVNILDTSYPPNENALVWSVSSAEAREARIRISYLLHRLDKSVVYKAVAGADEKSLVLENYMRLENYSGEDFEDAEVSIGYGQSFEKSFRHQEIVKVLSEKIEEVPIKKRLTWDAAKMPWDPEYQEQTVGIPLSYIIENNEAANLGKHTMLPGKARIFMKTGDGGDVAFTGEDWVELTPVGREMKLFIGESREVKVTQRKVKDDRINLRRNNANQIVMWDTEEHNRLEIENFKKEPIDLVVIEHIPGYWRVLESSHDYEREDAFTIEYNLSLPPESSGEKKTIVTFSLNRLNVQGNEPSTY
ncbi:MAG: hypothetical protein K9N52_10680 [Verrucomicrobia bacterium]|nr:hypothetical protein [Verrucomicrobiota bacterium]